MEISITRDRITFNQLQFVHTLVWGYMPPPPTHTQGYRCGVLFTLKLVTAEITWIVCWQCAVSGGGGVFLLWSRLLLIVSRESFSLRDTDVKPSVLKKQGSHHKYGPSCLACCSDSVTDGEWAVLSLGCAFHMLEKFLSKDILGGTAVCPYAVQCWNCLGELGLWLVLSQRGRP